MGLVIVSMNKEVGGQTLRGLATREFYACYRGEGGALLD